MSAVAASPRSRAAVRQAWLDRFARFATAGLSVTAFCRREAVSSQAFYYWKQQLAAHSKAPTPEQPRLLAVRLLARPTPVELVLPHGPSSAWRRAATWPSSAPTSRPWGSSHAEPLARHQALVLPGAR